MSDDKKQSAKKIDVQYVANLARLTLTEAEVLQFQSQLEHIVEHFNQLRSLDVDGVEPMAHATPIQNVFREDVEHSGLDRDLVLANAPQHSNDLIMVPTIVE
jgi:aspartyl-tRNA(Asn)/glutamyl-tRNA(Gln) amidotransferase subunit C